MSERDANSNSETGDQPTCHACGKGVDPEAKFCPFCGAKEPTAIHRGPEGGEPRASAATQVVWQSEAADEADTGREVHEDSFERIEPTEGPEVKPRGEAPGNKQTQVVWGGHEAAHRGPAEPSDAEMVGAEDGRSVQRDEMALSETMPAQEERGASGVGRGEEQERQQIEPGRPTAADVSEADFDLDTSEFSGPKRWLAAAVVLVFLVALSGVAFWIWRSANPTWADNEGDAVVQGVTGIEQPEEAEGGGAQGASASEDGVGAGEPMAARFAFAVETDADVDHEMAVIRFDGDEVLRLYTVQGTDFESLSERAQSVMVRLSWAAERYRMASARGDGAPEFRVRHRGNGYRVQWASGEDGEAGENGEAQSIGLVSINSEDVRHWRESGRETSGRAALAREISREIAGVFEMLSVEQEGEGPTAPGRS